MVARPLTGGVPIGVVARPADRALCRSRVRCCAWPNRQHFPDTLPGARVPQSEVLLFLAAIGHQVCITSSTTCLAGAPEELRLEWCNTALAPLYGIPARNALMWCEDIHVSRARR